MREICISLAASVSVEILVEQGLALEFSYFRGSGFEPVVSLAELVGKSGASVRAVGCHRCVGDEFFSAVLADFAVGSSWCVHSGSIGLHLRFSVSIFVQVCPTLSNLRSSLARWSERREILYRIRYKCGTNQDRKA